MHTLSLLHTGKQFRERWIFRNIDASFSSGEIVGLIGDNGSGKTLLLKCMLGLVSLTEGKILLDGKQVGIELEMLPSVGVILETPGFLNDRSGIDNLLYLASLRRKVSINQVRDTMTRLGLSPNQKLHVNKYSLGMRQRLGIAQAVMENNDILLLDEPFNAMDVDGVKVTSKILMEQRDSDKIIIVTGHKIETISSICNRIYEIHDGILKCIL